MRSVDVLEKELQETIQEYIAKFGEDDWEHMEPIVDPLNEYGGPVTLKAIEKLRNAIDTNTPLPYYEKPDGLVY